MIDNLHPFAAWITGIIVTGNESAITAEMAMSLGK